MVTVHFREKNEAGCFKLRKIAAFLNNGVILPNQSAFSE